MASAVTIDVDSEKGKDDDLQFQDIPHDDKWAPVSTPPEDIPKGKTHTFTNFPHSAADSDDEDSSEKTEFLKGKSNASFWTFGYYQQFFDVETKQVGTRILGSMLPRPGFNYMDISIRPNPDLYGPFWICTTLVFTTAIAGNLANYFQAAGQNYKWTYDFHKVTFAATAIFSYWWIVPFVLFGILWWRGNPARFSFLELICVYGYSLAIYIPISLLWVIPVGWLQWLLVIVGAVLSGSALLFTFWPAVKEDKKQVAIGLLVVIFLLHAALAMGFMLYFFHVPSRATGAATLSPANTTTVLPPKLPEGKLKNPAEEDKTKTPLAQNTAQQANQGNALSNVLLAQQPSDTGKDKGKEMSEKKGDAPAQKPESAKAEKKSNALSGLGNL